MVWIIASSALEISQATIGPNHPNLAIVRGNLDSLLQQLSGEKPQTYRSIAS
jgi:hypothetical protein